MPPSLKKTPLSNSNQSSDPCQEKIESLWQESFSGREWGNLGKVLRLFAVYNSVNGSLNAELSPVAKKRIAFLEKNLKLMELKDAKLCIEAIGYARKRISKGTGGPRYGENFSRGSNGASKEERSNAARTLCSSFLERLKNPVVEADSSDSASDEPGTGDMEFGDPELG